MGPDVQVLQEATTSRTGAFEEPFGTQPALYSGISFSMSLMVDLFEAGHSESVPCCETVPTTVIWVIRLS